MDQIEITGLLLVCTWVVPPFHIWFGVGTAIEVFGGTCESESWYVFL